MTERPRPRIGIHYGETLYRDGDYYGREVNLAARVVARAAGRRGARHAPGGRGGGHRDLEFEPIGEVRLKGFNEPTELFLARRPGAARRAPATTGPRPTACSSASAATGLLVPGRPVLVLLSGGRDSVCLLDVAVAPAGAGRRERAARQLRPARGGRRRRARTARRSARALGVELDGRARRAGPAARATSRPGRATCATPRPPRLALARRRAGRGRPHGHRPGRDRALPPRRLARPPRAAGHARRATGASSARCSRVTREETAAYCRGPRPGLARGRVQRRPPLTRAAALRDGLLPALRELHPAAEANVVRTAALLRDEAAVLDAVGRRTVLAGARRDRRRAPGRAARPRCARLVLRAPGRGRRRAARARRGPPRRRAAGPRLGRRQRGARPRRRACARSSSTGACAWSPRPTPRRPAAVRPGRSRARCASAPARWRPPRSSGAPCGSPPPRCCVDAAALAFWGCPPRARRSRRDLAPPRWASRRGYAPAADALFDATAASAALVAARGRGRLPVDRLARAGDRRATAAPRRRRARTAARAWPRDGPQDTDADGAAIGGSVLGGLRTSAAAPEPSPAADAARSARPLAADRLTRLRAACATPRSARSSSSRDELEHRVRELGDARSPATTRAATSCSSACSRAPSSSSRTSCATSRSPARSTSWPSPPTARRPTPRASCGSSRTSTPRSRAATC